MASVTGEGVRLGIVGGGLIAQIAHLPALMALGPSFDVVALADPSERARTALARRYGIDDTFPAHEDMLERGDLDAVLVASPNGTHARVTLDALEAGLHVLVEKPLCLTPGDAEAVVAAAGTRGLVVQVGYMKRFDAAYEALREQLPVPDALKLVSTATVDPGIGEWYRPADFVPADDTDGATAIALRRSTEEQVARAIGCDDPRHVKPFSDAFLGALVHDVNLVLGLLEHLELEPSRVTDAAAAPDGSLAYGTWAIGGGARLTAAWMLLPGASGFREELRVFAVDGVRCLGFAAPYDLSAPTRLDVGSVRSRFAPAAESYAAQLAHFRDCATGAASCRTPAAQGARDVALLTDLYRAAVAA